MTATRPSTRSVLWAGADTGGVAFLSLIGMLFMARLVGPSDFGVASLAVGVLGVVNLYVEGLLHDALIQKQETTDGDFDTAFWTVIAIGCGAFVLALLVCAALLDTPLRQFGLLFAGAAMALPITGINGVSNARLRRKFQYRAVAIPSVLGRLGGTAIGLGLAFAGAGAWSLVALYVAGVIIQAISLQSTAAWIPRFKISFRDLGPYWRFALPYAMMHSLVGVRIQAFTAMVAAFMGLSAAGFMNVAFRLTLTPQILLVTSLTNIGLPMLARHQDTPEGLQRAYYRLNRLVAMIVLPAFLGLAAAADRIVPVFLGSSWNASIWPIRIVATVAAIYLMRVPSALVLRAMGHVKYSLTNAIYHIVATLGAMAILRPSTPVYASLIWAAPLAPLLVATLFVVRRETGIPILGQIRSVLGPFIAAFIMALAVAQVDGVIWTPSPLLELGISISTGVTIYASLILLLDRSVRREVRAVLVRVRRRLLANGIGGDF